MKQALLAAVLAAIASSALTLLLAGSRPPPAAPAPAGMSAAEFKAALSDLEREVAALRQELPGLPSVPAEAASPSPRPPSAAAAPVVREPKSAEAPVAGPEERARFAEAIPRTADGSTDGDGRAAQKRRWLFRSERDVLDWFGLPFSVAAEGEKETWYYEVPTGIKDENGDPEYLNYWIVLNRGRLTDMGD